MCDVIKSRANGLSLVTGHFVTALARSHADALHRLEKFAFGLDRWRDDDLRLLKLSQVFRADVAHARGNGADEILTAVINFGGAEQNLFQRTSRTDFDSRSARKILVRSRHSPMIAMPRRFL